MKKFLKWTGFVVLGLAGIVVCAVAWLYWASEREMNRDFTVAETAELVIPTDAQSIAEGQRIAQMAGCQHCHGEKFTGGVVDDIPNLVRLVAPNASMLLPQYSDQQLATMLRKGVKPDGKSVLFMPSEMFRHLGDQDVARLIAYLRTVPATPEGVTEKTEVRLLGRFILANGAYKPPARAIELLPTASSSFDANDPVSHGRHLTMSFCTECHGQSLEGFAPINAPPLAIVKGYSAEQFAKLMQDGTALGDRQLALMSPTAKVRFSHLKPEEVSAMYEFLKAREG